MSTTGNGRFSVAIPCYRYGHYLADCVESVVSQRDVEVDVLIVDDASPDDSFAVAQELASTHPNVTAVRHDTNQGHIVTFNDGVRWADNEFFVLLSADDRLAPGALARAKTVFGAFPAVAMVYGPVEEFETTPPQVVDHEAGRPVVWSGADWIRRCCRLADNPTYSPEVIVRTEIQHRVGLYDARCGHTSDLNMWLRVAAEGDVAFVPDVVQAFYRVHGGNMSRTTFGEKLTQVEHRGDAFDAFFETPGRGRTPRDRRIAGAALSTWAMWEASKSIERRNLAVDELGEHLRVAARFDTHHRRRVASVGLRLRARMGPTASRLFPGFWMARSVRFGRRLLRERSLRRRGA